MTTHPYETIETFVAKLKTLNPEHHVNFDVSKRQVTNPRYVEGRDRVEGYQTSFDDSGWKAIAFLMVNEKIGVSDSGASKVSEVLEYLEPLVETHADSIVCLIHSEEPSPPFYFIDSSACKPVYNFMRLGDDNVDHETWGRTQKWNNCHLKQIARNEFDKKSILSKIERFNEVADNNKELFSGFVQLILAPSFQNIQMFTYDGKMFFSWVEIDEYCKVQTPPRVNVNPSEIRIFNQKIIEWSAESSSTASNSTASSSTASSSTVSTDAACSKPDPQISTFDFVGDKGEILVTDDKPSKSLSQSVPTPVSSGEDVVIPTSTSLISDQIPMIPRIPSPIPTIPRMPSPVPVSPSSPRYKIGELIFNTVEDLTKAYALKPESIKVLFEQSPSDPMLLICQLSDDIMSGFKL